VGRLSGALGSGFRTELGQTDGRLTGRAGGEAGPELSGSERLASPPLRPGGWLQDLLDECGQSRLSGYRRDGLRKLHRLVLVPGVVSDQPFLHSSRSPSAQDFRSGGFSTTSDPDGTRPAARICPLKHSKPSAAACRSGKPSVGWGYRVVKQEVVKARLHRARQLLRKKLYAAVGPLRREAFRFAGTRCEGMWWERIFPAITASVERTG